MADLPRERAVAQLDHQPHRVKTQVGIMLFVHPSAEGL